MNEFQTKLVDTFNDCFPAWKKDIISIEPDTEDDHTIIVAMKFSVKRFGEKDTGEIFMETL